MWIWVYLIVFPEMYYVRLRMFQKSKHGFLDYIDFFLPTQSDVLDPICSSKTICIWSLRANLEVRRTVCAIYLLGGSGNIITENSNWTALVRRLLVIVRRRNPMICINVDNVLYPGPSLLYLSAGGVCSWCILILRRVANFLPIFLYFAKSIST